MKLTSLREDKNVKKKKKKTIKLKTSQLATGQMTTSAPLQSRKQRARERFIEGDILRERETWRKKNTLIKTSHKQWGSLYICLLNLTHAVPKHIHA